MRQLAFLFALSVLSHVGCTRDCLLDDYRLVDQLPPSGGFPPTSSSVGGGGGSGGEGGGDVCTEVTGAVYVASAVAAGENGAAPCVQTASAEGGVELMAFDPGDGACLAHARILQRDNALVAAPLRVSFEAGDLFYVAGSYIIGSLELPAACSDNAMLSIATEVGASVTHFVARIRQNGLGMCTEWVRRLWSADAVAAAIHDVHRDGSGGVVLSGSLDGGAFEIEDGSATTPAQGQAFVARFDADGSLVDIDVRGDAAFDAAYGATDVDGDLLITGTLRHEAPACHGCNGASEVSDPAGDCPSGTGGASGLPDSQNAWLWSRYAADVNCASFHSYGADGLGTDDAQVGHHIAARRSATGCASYWTGISGKQGWRFDAADPASGLDDIGGVNADGFLFALGGDECGADGQHLANIRLSAPLPGLATWGNRVAAHQCEEAVTLTAFVAGGAAVLDVHRCQEGSCSETNVPLPASARQLVVGKLGADLVPAWWGALGPVTEDFFLIDNGAGGQVRDNLALDGRDHAFVSFTTSDALAVSNLDTTSCSALDGAAAGDFVMALEPNGVGAAARCVWAHRLGP